MKEPYHRGKGVRISQYADPNNDWSRFPRTSGLPIGYFDPPWYRRQLPDSWVVVFVLCCAFVALML